MWKNITDTIGNITTVAVQLIGLSVALEVVFGANVPFLSLGVIDNISSILLEYFEFINLIGPIAAAAGIQVIFP